MTAPTPAPWDIAFGQDGASVYTTTGGTIATIPIDLIAWRDNAHVIATAHELLSAMEALFENCAMIHSRWGSHSNAKEADKAIADAKAAMAKARGES